MLHRVFIAIELPKNIKEELGSYQNEFKQILPAKWVEPENLHITLAFLGNQTDEKILKIKEILRNITSNFSHFNLETKKIVFGPEKNYNFEKLNKIPNLIWVEIQKNELIKELYQKIYDNLKTINIFLENREFIPHSTLCRLRTWEFKRLDLDEILSLERDIFLSFKVDKIVLMESILKRKGPEYKVLETFNLK
ncbi:MAG: RNA 2',3'-cyclic phosphodiesterase [Minisyncoccia bacterium]